MHLEFDEDGVSEIVRRRIRLRQRQENGWRFVWFCVGFGVATALLFLTKG